MKIATPFARRRARLSITPLIDVVFILLFFFMLASSFERWQALDMKLSSNGSPASPGDEVRTLRVPVRVGAEVNLDGEWLTLDALLTRLSTTDSHTQLLLSPERDTPIQDLVQVLERVRAEGRHRVTLAVTR